MTAGAIAHDYFALRGGGERLVLALAGALDWPVLTGFVKPEAYEHAWFEDVKVRELGCYQGWKPLQMWHLARRFRSGRAGQVLRGAETVLFSGVYAPLAAGRRVKGRNVLYCHTPPRFVFDRREFFRRRYPLWQRPLFDWMVCRIRKQYVDALGKMHRVAANSENVRRRLHRYLGCEARVVHPPCDTDHFKWRGQGDYYLSTARLDPLKRVNLVVEAFRRMPDKKLVVTSGGPELGRLKELAQGAGNISFTGWVGEERLQELVGNAVATLYVPVDEDFGMAPVESMAAGKPVIGVAEGGLLETVGQGGERGAHGAESIAHGAEGRAHGAEGRGQGPEGRGGKKDFLITKHGVLVPAEPGAADIIAAVEWMTPRRAKEMRGACEKRARLFRTEVFVEKMREVLGVSRAEDA